MWACPATALRGSRGSPPWTGCGAELQESPAWIGIRRMLSRQRPLRTLPSAKYSLRVNTRRSYFEMCLKCVWNNEPVCTSLVKMREICCSFCFSRGGCPWPREGREPGSQPGSKGLPALGCPPGFFHPMPFLYEPLAFCVTKMQNRIGFVSTPWPVNAL